MATKKTTKPRVQIEPPKFKHACFEIKGINGPLVQHRFSAKVKADMREKMEEGKSAGSKKKRVAVDTDELYNDARYISKDGWDGFNAASIRNAMISACRLVGFKMTLAKLSVFVEADGYDAKEPQFNLVRIYGKPVKQEDICRTSTGQPYVCFRPAYHGWSAKVKIRWDADQFSLADVSNLLVRVGLQVGIGEGRYDSKSSPGMGWGCFDMVRAK